jgi:hypothetical protein
MRFRAACTQQLPPSCPPFSAYCLSLSTKVSMDPGLELLGVGRLAQLLPQVVHLETGSQCGTSAWDIRRMAPITREGGTLNSL